MKKTFGIISVLLITLSLNGQVAIRGTVFDALTKTKIVGVSISPVFYGDSAITDYAGRFKKLIPKDYRESLIFSHPDYYPFKEPIRKGSRMYPHTIYLTPKIVKLDTLLFLDDSNNELIRVEVSEAGTKEPVSGAAIRLQNRDIIAYTDIEGYALVTFPRTIKSYLITHDHFDSREVSIRFNGPKKPAPHIVLERQIFRPIDTAWKARKNAIGWAPGELLSGAIGLHYERFLNPKNSIGLHTSFYAFGCVLRPLYYNYSRFNGIKLAPFYRYYISRNKYKGLFLEGKLLWGYFDFYKLTYLVGYEDYNSYNINYDFQSMGFGVSIGTMIIPNLKSFDLNLSVGYQYFPAEFISYTDESGNVYPYDDSWWYWGGPGSMIEIKFTIGGIF